MKHETENQEFFYAVADVEIYGYGKTKEEAVNAARTTLDEPDLEVCVLDKLNGVQGAMRFIKITPALAAEFDDPMSMPVFVELPSGIHGTTAERLSRND